MAVALDKELFAVAMLIDELKHTETQCRVNAMQKLHVIGECNLPI